MNCREMTERDLEPVARRYIEYYNNEEEGCWTFEKAYRRIRQVFRMDDAMCLVQEDGAGELTGFVMGYFKEYDDLRGYWLDEIVIFSGYKGRGLGTELLREAEKRALENGASLVELSSVNDEHHMHFYGKEGFYRAGNFVPMAKFLEDE